MRVAILDFRLTIWDFSYGIVASGGVCHAVPVHPEQHSAISVQPCPLGFITFRTLTEMKNLVWNPKSKI